MALAGGAVSRSRDVAIEVRLRLRTVGDMSKTNGKVRARAKALPKRSQVKQEDTWDLASLFPGDQEWETAFTLWSTKLTGFAPFRGKLAESAKTLAACLQFDADFDLEAERLGNYAFLKTAEDQGNSDYQRMKGRFQHIATQAAEAASFIRPEIMAIKPTVMAKFLKDEALAPWRLALDQLLRFRPHTLSDKEEQLLAMQGQMSTAAGNIFRQLNDADLKFGMIKNEKGETLELGHSSFSALLHAPKRSVRQQAFHQYYAQFDAHRNTIAAALHGSVQRDVYYAKAKKYPSALEHSLFADNVPVSVYDNLIGSVHKNLPAVYRYYDLRKRKMKLREIHQYDTYVPILSELDSTLR